MKRIVKFPHPNTATEDGLVAIGGDLEVDTIIEAYKNGIFPWPISLDFPLAWFSPNPRGILDFNKLHISKSFYKFLKKNKFEVTFNQDFTQVINQCARVKRKDQHSTWITPDIIKGYIKLFEKKLAYSVEVWDLDKRLVAGLYGVQIGDFISGESMFTIEDNGSKLALYSLIEKLKSNGIKWLDTQMVTPIVSQFGGEYISRDIFLKKIETINWNYQFIY